MTLQCPAQGFAHFDHLICAGAWIPLDMKMSSCGNYLENISPNKQTNITCSCFQGFTPLYFIALSCKVQLFDKKCFKGNVLNVLE